MSPSLSANLGAAIRSSERSRKRNLMSSEAGTSADKIRLIVTRLSPGGRMASLLRLVYTGAFGSALLGCASASPPRTATSGPTPQGDASDPHSLVASLNPTNNAGNRILGTVRLTPVAAGEYRAEVSIRNGGGVQNKYPWVVRAGQCGEATTPPVGLEVGYAPLETSGDGTARIRVPLKITIPDGVHHVEILRSPSERQTVVACGVLSPVP